ncbi:hypothetical protein [Rufibacter tibetensis]|uniref:Peptidase M28 domain-containing protein n=1 Tax=Rufibacter tibetensis TaxID=512763 RepID=A0A0P0C0S0_9BACT|nr:hypothetical protein [Rufibacter tibetensis]ALI98101.1 hypothetical protein DC20_02795 [Rufibacter tibetensis]
MTKTNPFDFKNTFLNLTQYTVPYGYESQLEPYLPEGVQKDDFGNYFIRIGESATLFTAHLDTCSSEYEKVNHVFEGNIIRTDGSTILGGDNKAGVTILLYLISKGVPGTYYFFVGEEIGCLGSRAALRADASFFAQFKRAVAFDRRKVGSIITHQRGGRCCSEQFADALSHQFSNQGLDYQADPYGVFTDTAVFVDVIPECTNLSSGVWGEHTSEEYVDILLLEEIARAAERIAWDSLPTHRRLPSNYSQVA